MKKLLFIIASVVVLLSMGGHGYAINKTIYFDSHWDRVPGIKNAAYVRTANVNKNKDGNYEIEDRYINGKKQMTGSYTDTTYSIENGFFTYYDTSGVKFLEGQYDHAKKISEWKYYYWKYRSSDLFSGRYEDTNAEFSYKINFGKGFRTCDDIDINTTMLNNFLGFAVTRFENHFNISGAVFYNTAYMHHNFFYAPVLFATDSINSLDLSSSIFHSEFTFTGNYVNENLSFANDTFYKTFRLNNISLGKNGQIIFNNTLLPDTLDFSSNERISNQVDLLVADFSDTARYDTAQKIYKKPHYINLYKSDISKFHLDYFHFRLYFPPDLNLDERNSVYEALLNNFKTRGQDDSYEKLDIEYKAYKYLHTPNKHWLNYIDKWWWNYGYDKDLVFVHAAFFLIFFTFITFIILGFLNDEVYSMDDIKYTIPLSMQKYRNTEPEENKESSTDYTIAASSKLSALYKEGGLDIKIKPVARNSVYTEQYKTIIYCLFLGAFTIFLFSYYGLERFVLKKHVVASILHHRYAKLKWGAGITAILLMLWIIRNKLYEYKTVIFLDSVFTRFWLSLVYTSKLFFPLFIKIENLKYKHQLLVFYVLFVYLVGILCIGYMTNFVFQK